MKWLVVVVVLAFVGYMVMSGGDEPVASAPASAAAPATGGTSASGSGDAASDPARITTAEELKTEIEDLMAEYDRYRDDPVKRQEIQAEMDALMRDYNETVLPIAVDQVKEGN